MADNTPGFEFNENPASPNSEASAVNLNNLVKKAVIRNIAPRAVASTHLHESVAGAGLGGGNGTALFIKTDEATLEVADDKIGVKDGGIGEAQIADGAITMDKLAEAVKVAITTVIKGIYKVGDYFITHNEEDPAKRFGGQWELVKDKFLIGAGGDYDLLTEGGEKEHTLTTEEIPSHKHELQTDIVADWRGGGEHLESSGGNLERSPNPPYTKETGGGKAHNNMPPYKAVYIWVKISDEDVNNDD